MAASSSRTTAYARRYHLLDVLRGLTLISMIAYHAAWDLVYIAGVDWPWYQSQSAWFWQQSICWTFILLSGFCTTLSSHPYRRGLEVFGGGLLVTAVTLVFLPEDRVVFGVLTFLGSAMLLTALLQRWLRQIHAVFGFAVCALLFWVFRDVNAGTLQFFGNVTIGLPSVLYQGLPATYLGFTEPGFYSTDYFSVLPWIFLFWCGMYLGVLLRKDGTMQSRVMQIDIPPLSFLGRHSLLIYLLHQPVLYLIVMLCSMAGLW